MSKKYVFHILTVFMPKKKTWERLRENRIYKKKWLVHPKVDFFNKIIVYTHLRI